MNLALIQIEEKISKIYMLSFRCQVKQYRKAAAFKELLIEQTVLAHMKERTSVSDEA